MTTPINYEPNFPTPDQLINNSQQQFQQNFQAIYNAFAANHIALDASSGAGNHTVIQLFEQDTQFKTNTGEISVYSKDVSGQTDQIFMRYQGNQTEFQFSNYQTYSHTTSNQITYITFLPGNLLVYFGQVGPADNLQLNPYVAKNIVSATFCAIGTTPFLTPNIGVVASGDFYTQIVIAPPIQGPKPSYYFLCVANI